MKQSTRQVLSDVEVVGRFQRNRTHASARRFVVGGADLGLELMQAVHVGDRQGIDLPRYRKRVSRRHGIERAETEAALPAGGIVVGFCKAFGEARIFGYERPAAVAREVGAEDAKFQGCL